jgi:hypothetical protein
MAQSIKEISRMICDTEKEEWIIEMVKAIKEAGSMTREKATGPYRGQMEISMQACGRMTRDMVMGSIGRAEADMNASGTKVNHKGMEHITSKMVKYEMQRWHMIKIMGTLKLNQKISQLNMLLIKGNLMD